MDTAQWQQTCRTPELVEQLLPQYPANLLLGILAVQAVRADQQDVLFLDNPYGGYSGGYKHCATGITHWRSIASHHVPQVMHRPDFVSWK